MSRVATNLPTINYTNGYSPANKAMLTRPLTNGNTMKNVSNANFNIRSAAPAPIQKETVHACPLCNHEYKDPRVLPCTHTYCFDCIRDKLIQNTRLTCPKCHHQVHPFEEFELKNLPPNLILSQEWRIGTRPLISTTPIIKKPITYQSNVSIPINQSTINTTEMFQQQDKPKNSSTEQITNVSGIAAVVNTFDEYENEQISSTQQPANVSNLIKVYSEALTKTKTKEQDSIKSTGKHDELVKIFEQASNQNQQRRPSSSTYIKQQAKNQDETYVEINEDNLVQEIPKTPVFPQQLQSTIVYPNYTPSSAQKPISVSLRKKSNSTIGNLCNVETSIHDDSPEISPSVQPISITKQLNNFHQTNISQDEDDEDDEEEEDDDDDDDHLHVHQIIDSILPEQTNSIESPLKSNENLQDDKQFYRTSSLTSSRRSSDRFPPPPLNLESLNSPANENHQQHSSFQEQEESYSPEIKATRTERFSPDKTNYIPTTIQQIESHFSTPTISYRTQENLSRSISVNSRVDHLLSDQKRLEREIAEQIRHLKYDYDDIRRQIDQKQSTIHNEVKNIALRLDDDITQHYQRKQQIYADLASDANHLGDELQNLKSNSIHSSKQQLWSNLEQIELNLQNIRQAVEQHRESHNALTFSQTQQITYPNQNYSSSTTTTTTTTTATPNEQTITNLTPYKYIKIDHLSTLEPEAIAISDDNKKILLGICNKLFILNEFGDVLKTISLTPSIRGIAIAKKGSLQNLAYISHDEIVSMIDIENGQILDCVKETDSTGESGTFLPLGIDTDKAYGNVYVCDYRNSCIIKFDQKLEFLTQWRIYNHSDQYDEARPKLISVYGEKFYMIVEHSCKPYYNQGIAYTFSLHICDVNSGSIIKIIDADALSTQRLRWPCSVQAIDHEKCLILDTMTSGKYFNGQWQKHWSRVLEINEDEKNLLTELFQLDSEAATMAMTKQTMIIAANDELLFVDFAFLQQQQQHFSQ